MARDSTSTHIILMVPRPPMPLAIHRVVLVVAFWELTRSENSAYLHQVTPLSPARVAAPSLMQLRSLALTIFMAQLLSSCGIARWMPAIFSTPRSCHTNATNLVEVLAARSEKAGHSFSRTTRGCVVGKVRQPFLMYPAPMLAKVY